MKYFFLYNLGTAGESRMRDLERQIGPDVDYEMVDADSPRGVDLATMHDILARPAILLVRSDGSLIEAWTETERFPPIGELRYRAVNG